MWSLIFDFVRRCMKRKETFIDSGMNLLTATISVANPNVGIVLSALSPIIESGVKSIIPKSLSEREDVRVEAVFMQVVQKISDKLKQGKVPRSDEIYYANGIEIPNAQEVFEGVLLKAREEHQAKKLSFYSNFFANLCFDETIDMDHAHYLLGLIERLTYRQLVVLAYLSDGKCVDTNRWDPSFKVSHTSELYKYYDFYSEYVDLYNVRLVTQAVGKLPGFAVGMSETKISDMGFSISRLLELHEIPANDLSKVQANFDAIKAIIDRS